LIATRCTGGTLEKSAAVRSFSATIGHTLRRCFGGGGDFAWGGETGRPAADFGTAAFMRRGAGRLGELPGLGGVTTDGLVKVKDAWHWGFDPWHPFAVSASSAVKSLGGG